MGEITAFPSGLSSFGGVLTPAFPITGDSNVIWCDNVAGNDGFDGSSPSSAVATIARGYSLLRAGHYDTLIVIGRGTAYTLSAALVWSKDYTNLFGFTAPIKVAERARITSGAVNTLTPMVTFSGTGISVQNLQFAQFGNSATTSAVCVLVTGQRCLFSKVHFAGGNNATNRGGTAMRSLVVSGGGGGNGENLFDECTIGVDTTDTAGANFELQLTANTPRNYFKNCLFTKRTVTGGAGGGFIVFDAVGIDRWTIFENPIFHNFIIGGGVVLTTALTINATDGNIILRNPISVGATGLSGGTKTNLLSDPVVGTGTSGLSWNHRRSQELAVNGLEAFADAIMYFESGGWKPGTKAYTHRNPGNLEDVHGAYRVFTSFVEGYEALVMDLQDKFLGHTKTGLGPDSTVLQLMMKYAPPADNNPTQSYTNFICNWLTKALGITVVTAAT